MKNAMFPLRDIRLDILRFIAITLVLGRHSYMYLPKENNSLLTDFFISWTRIGWVGVDLFFIISGFLISDLIFKDTILNRFTFKNFFIRRELKIYPPFLLLIIVSIAFFYVRHHPFNFYQVLAELFFVQNYFEGLWNHTWSLAIEEHFYLLLPLTVTYLFKKDRISRLPVILFLLMIVILIGRIVYVSLSTPSKNEPFIFVTHLRMDGFVPGVLIAYVKNFKKEMFSKLMTLNKGIYCLIFFLAMIFLRHTPNGTAYMLTIGFTILSIGFAALLLLFLATNKKYFEKWIILRWISSIGKSSYQIYLWHMCVMYWILSAIVQITHLSIPYYIMIPMYVIISILVGIVMDKLIEQPVLRFRNKYFPSLQKKTKMISLVNYDA